jgi:hypothetical protein
MAKRIQAIAKNGSESFAWTSDHSIYWFNQSSNAWVQLPPIPDDPAPAADEPQELFGRTGVVS